MFRQVIGLVGLPRSGTTMLASILGVHSRIEAVYEPWNRDEEDRKAPPDLEFAQFVRQFASSAVDKDVLLVKETATHLTYLDYMERFLRSTAPPVTTDLILLWRNPFHVFLSEIEARKKWWGDADVVISPEEFDRWADPRVGGLARMIEMGREFDAVLIHYEALVRDKDRVVPALMDELKLEFDPRQLDYEKYLEKERVRGDITIATDPSPISDSSVKRRAEQLPALQEMIKGAAWYERVIAASKAVPAIGGSGIARFRRGRLKRRRRASVKPARGRQSH